MVAVHELGHVLGAVLTGGQCVAVVLHPLAISRTDINPNPYPLVVAWMGPVAGVAIPLTAWWLVGQKGNCYAGVLRFWAGFCCVANGAYLGFGAFEAIGDSGDILRWGSPFWMLQVFGLLSVTTGILVWHRMGGLIDWLRVHSITIASKHWWQMLCAAVVSALLQIGLFDA